MEWFKNMTGVSPYKAQPVEVFNYYAFGMLIPGFFSNASPDYRFGFNSMLRDDDVRDKEGEIYNKNIGDKENEIEI